jgi:hypothetical protein
LTLPAGELVGIAGCVGSVEADQLQHLLDSLPALVSVTDTVETKALRDDRPNLRPGIKRAVWILKNDLNPPAEGF